MKKLFLASNQLPVHINWNDGDFKIESGEELTVSGLKNFYAGFETQWIGGTGLDEMDLIQEEQNALTNSLVEFRCTPIFPGPEDYNLYLHGFSKNTIYPLFHYFTQNADYHDESWEAYQRVNQLYADHILSIIKEGDILWVHDFHLMLLPQMIKDKLPGVQVGLFIHIPFPSFEIFRLLPWRVEIIEGMLGADLVGFHTYDYVRHFLSCVRRVVGIETIFNRISIGERTLKVDAFPKGINFDIFEERLKSTSKKKDDYLAAHLVKKPDEKIILSIGKLDYTKGIPLRLKAFELLLKENPEYLEKVSLLLLSMNSGETEPVYDAIKREVDELVGNINGSYGTITWTPIRYLNREFSIEELIDIYKLADIAIIVPLRDGMNLISKEYIASSNKGVLILSEMAGAAKELHEALIVNPNNLGNIVAAIKEALEMPEEEQIRRNLVMLERLKRYPVDRWANEFVKSLENVTENQRTSLTRKVNLTRMKQLVSAYKDADKRILFLDYDGTLSEFQKNPEDAKPDKELYEIIKKLLKDKKNTVTIISGRDKETLSRWFDEKWNIHFIAEHGVWLKDPGGEWQMMEQIDNTWRESVEPLLEYYVDQTPKSFIEYKNFSLVWHYRKADPDLGIQRAWELKDELRTLTSNLNLEIMDGDKVLEIKYSGINKGRAALHKMGEDQYDFIFAVGDDWTDEYTFEAMPEQAYTIKVGAKTTAADFYAESVTMVRKMLTCLGNESCGEGV